MSYSVYVLLGVDIYASDRTVLRALYRRFDPSKRYSRDYRESRHHLAREVLKHHWEARRLALHFAL